MPLNSFLTVSLVLIILFYFLGQKKALNLRLSGQSLHSLPSYHGSWMIIAGVLPAAVLLSIWTLVDSSIIRSILMSELPSLFSNYSVPQKNLVYNEILNLSQGRVGSANQDLLMPLAARYVELNQLSLAFKFSLASVLSIMGVIYAWRKISSDFRARNTFERIVKSALFVCASLAILTTVGIIFSVLFESLRFFNQVSLRL